MPKPGIRRAVSDGPPSGVQTSIMRACLSEMLASFMTCAPALAAHCSVALLGVKLSNYEQALIAGGALSMSIYAAARISGGHVSPAVTMSFVLTGKFPVRRLFPYAMAQLLGAFIATALTYSLFTEAWARVEAKNHIDIDDPVSVMRMLSILIPTPHKAVSSAIAFAVEIISVAIIFFMIFAVLDVRKDLAREPLVPVLLGIAVALNAAVFGALSGGSINPARDLGSRIFMLLPGRYGLLPLTSGRKFPHVITGTLAPFIGATIGTLLYTQSLSPRLDGIDDEEEEEELLYSAQDSTDLPPRHQV